MITKNAYFRSLMLAGAMMLAFCASADSYFFIDDPVIKPKDFGTKITVPVKASFDKPVSSWDVQFTFPEGLIPTRVQPGIDMNFSYTNDQGEINQLRFDVGHNDELTHFVSCTYGWREYQNEDELDLSSLMKWDTGVHNEMFLLTFLVAEDFQGGEIGVHTFTSRGNDLSGDITVDPTVTDFVREADVNSDGEINISDVTTLMNYIIFGPDYDPYGTDDDLQYHVGDINHDGNLSITDLEVLCDYLWTAEWFQGYELNEANSSSMVTIIQNLPTMVNFYIDPIELTPDKLGQDITIPVKADFEGYTSAWDVEFTFPYGLTPVNYTPGRHMTVDVLTNHGTTRSATAWNYYNTDYTHVVAAMMEADYQVNAEGDYEICGSAKWEPGEYDEMFLLTLHVADDFFGGEITIKGVSTCGSDIRNDALVFWPEPMPSYDYPEYDYLMGDVNHDGLINVTDVTLYVNYLCGNEDDSFSVNSADTHGDEFIDLLDMQKVIDFLIDDGKWYEGYVLNVAEENYAYAYVDFPPITPGDMNGDGTINISDAITLISMLLTETPVDESYADANGDGAVNISDVIYIINIISQRH